MTSKQRSYLIGLASKLDPILSIGKSGVTPEVCQAAEEALAARELIKVNTLKNCFEDLTELSATLADRTHARVIKVIGRKIILYRENPRKKDKIILP